MVSKIFAVWMVMGLVLLSSTMSLGAGTPYVSGRVSYSIADDEDMGFLDDVEFEDFASFAGAFGFDFERPYALLRFEGEISYRRNDIDDARVGGDRVNGNGDVSALSLMVNFVCDIENPTIFKPYALVGVGGAWVSINDAEVKDVKVVDDDRIQAAFQVGGGIAAYVSESVAIDAGYSFFSTSRNNFDDETGDDFDFRYTTHNISLGLRYRF